MVIISRRPLREFSEQHPTAKTPLDAWYAEVKLASWRHFVDVRATFGSADVVAGNRVIFDLGGNKFRLVARIAYRTRTVFVLFVGTHEEYDQIDVKAIRYKKSRKP